MSKFKSFGPNFASYLSFGPSLKSIVPPVGFCSDSKYLPNLRSYLIGEFGVVVQADNRTLEIIKHTIKRACFLYLKPRCY